MAIKSLLSLIAVVVAISPANNLAFALTTTTSKSSSSRIRSRSPLSSVELPRLVESTIEEQKTIEETLTSNTGNAPDKNLSPFLQGMVDEQRELQVNVGKAMDVLRADYPYFLKRAPDYSIYHDSISLSASDGQMQLSKLPSYKNAFSVMRTMCSLLYDMDASVVQSRMVYDVARSEIRVSFNAMLVPKLFSGGKTVHVDGISAYSLDLSSTVRKDGTKNEGAGKIIEHRIERMMMNGAAFGFEGLMPGQTKKGTQLAGGAWGFDL